MSDARQCCGEVYKPGVNGWFGSYRRCTRPGKFYREGKSLDGKWYCGIHDPVKRADKRAARDAQRNAAWEADRRRRQLERAAPDLLAVLERIVADDRAAIDPDDYEAARAAIRKAKGDSPVPAKKENEHG